MLTQTGREITGHQAGGFAFLIFSSTTIRLQQKR
jgi:hypothetical protein